MFPEPSKQDRVVSRTDTSLSGRAPRVYSSIGKPIRGVDPGRGPVTHHGNKWSPTTDTAIRTVGEPAARHLSDEQAPCCVSTLAQRLTFEVRSPDFWRFWNSLRSGTLAPESPSGAYRMTQTTASTCLFHSPRVIVFKWFSFRLLLFQRPVGFYLLCFYFFKFFGSFVN